MDINGTRFTTESVTFLNMIIFNMKIIMDQLPENFDYYLFRLFRFGLIDEIPGLENMDLSNKISAFLNHPEIQFENSPFSARDKFTINPLRYIDVVISDLHDKWPTREEFYAALDKLWLLLTDPRVIKFGQIQPQIDYLLDLGFTESDLDMYLDSKPGTLQFRVIQNLLRDGFEKMIDTFWSPDDTAMIAIHDGNVKTFIEIIENFDINPQPLYELLLKPKYSDLETEHFLMLRALRKYYPQ